MDTIQVFDTTLRDGEQSPGASMEVEQKVNIARSLAGMGVDVIEAGFPISSPKQFEGTKLICEQVRTSTIAGLSRAIQKDIDIAAEALKKAANSRVHTFLATSPLHREYKLRKSKEEIIEIVSWAVKYAKNLCSEVEFSAEDALRTEKDYLAEVVDAAIKAGASIVNIPDTVGYATPQEIEEYFTYLREHVDKIDTIILSAHCHDDLGLATANTLTAIKAGARQVEVTVNGIGERAGNAALEEIVTGIGIRNDFWKVRTNVDPSKIYTTSRLLSATIGYPIPRNKAIIGENAFAHEAGIHQDGVLKHRGTYEILTPDYVGRKSNNIVLGRHSGLNGLRSRLKHLSIHVEEETLQELYKKFLEIADKKREVYDSDLIAIVSNFEEEEDNTFFKIEHFSMYLEPNTQPRAEVTLRIGEKNKKASASGDGPIDAIFSAICSLVDYTVVLEEYHVTAISPGTNALGEAVAVTTIEGKECIGRASSTDILEASAHAFVYALNHFQFYLLHSNNEHKES
ncbi:2-isopropylmalate synthase-like [Ylistrum balloti]|uniref:2-isopropylmalate synthase-like n=1 Tax=Ylistrum balloti TaxID=509963 RepID=UPI002905E969|nr:2-isopropylmalate synthase-like [Ylistrum balloti]